jgi:hypothetical protein
VLWSNAKIADASDPGRYITLPAAVRFIEPIVLGLVLAFALLFGDQRREPVSSNLLRWLAVLFMAGVVGSLLFSPGLLNALYGIYDVAVGFLLLLTLSVLRVNRDELRTLTAYLYVLCFLNLLIGIRQALVLGIQADRIHGLYDDANTMSTVLYVFSAYCLYRYVASRSIIHLLYALALISIAYLGFNEKLNLFFLAVMLPLLGLRLRKSPLLIASAGIAVVLLVGVTVTLASRSGMLGRTTAVSDIIRLRGGWAALGFVRSWPIAWQQISHQPTTVLFGIGPSNFGGAVAASRFNNGTAASITNELFQFQTSNEYLGAFDSPTNYFSNMLAEFGVIGLLAVLALLITVVRALHVAGKRLSNPELVAWAWAAKWGWVVVSMQAFFVPFGVFGNLAVMTPITIASAVVVGEWCRQRTATTNVGNTDGE